MLPKISAIVSDGQIMISVRELDNPIKFGLKMLKKVRKAGVKIVKELI